MERIEQIKDYIEKNRDKFPEDELISYLLKIGVTKKEIKEAKQRMMEGRVSKFHITKYLKPILIASAALITIIAITLLILNLPKNCGYDKNCFITTANECGKAVVREDLGGSTLKYSTKNCILTKGIEKVARTEPKEVREALEGASMSCEYKQYNFDSGLAENIAYGLAECHGPLKTALYELKILEMELGG